MGKAAKPTKPTKPAKSVVGDLDGTAVLVRDAAAAKRLHERVLAGDLSDDGTLRLSLTEAAWAAAQGRLTVTDHGVPLDPSDVATATGRAKGAAMLTVYTDLRERGLAVRHQESRGGMGAGDALSVWPRGVGTDGPPAYQVRPETEDGSILAADLHTRGGVIYGIVDHDGSVTYYEAEPASPQGAAVARAAEAPAAKDEPDEPAPVKAARGALQEARVTVRSGFRFGTHLRGYRGDPDDEHADWIVQCAVGTDRLPWLQLARGIRVAHAVRKSFLVAVSGPDGPAGQGAASMGTAFVELSWFKP